MLVVYAGLINWIVTTIFVESHLFARPRDWVVRKGLVVVTQTGRHRMPYIWPEDTTAEEADAGRIVPYGWRGKFSQLVTCHLCVRVWVGFALALYLGGPLGGWAAPVANGLLYAAAGHLVLELRSRVALVEPPTEH